MGEKNEVVDTEHMDRLKNYIDTFHIRYSHIAVGIGLDKSTLPKYFKQGKLSKDRYNQIVDYLREDANGDALKLFLIDNWLIDGISLIEQRFMKFTKRVSEALEEAMIEELTR